MDARKKRMLVIQAIETVESDIKILTRRLDLIKEMAEATADDDEFIKWLDEQEDLEDGLISIRLY